MRDLVSKCSAWWARAHPESDPPDYPFAPSDIGQLHRLCSDPAGFALDQATWKDLLLDAYSARLSGQVSIFGRQVLHQRLRAGLDDAQCAALGERLRELMSDPARLEQLHRTCRWLRYADQEIATLLYEDVAPAVPWWAGQGWVLTLALLGSLVALAWSPLALLGTGVVLYLLMSTQMRYSERVEPWERSINSVQMLLRVVSLLGERAPEAGKLNRSLSRSMATRTVPGLRGYQDWFMLENVNHYFKGVRLIHANLAFLRECFSHCASLEADIALARHLLQTPLHCRAVRGPHSELELDQTVHPLLSQAQPLSINLHGLGAFISGQSGVGKSTLLRTVGLNLVSARAFGFCYASRARVPHLPVYTSMQSEDSMFGGESLYLAELRRAGELLAAANGRHPVICLIDEIFRGTNHLESVSAAAAVLDLLAARALVIVSSHNLVLAALLEHRLAPLCVTIGGQGKLTLEPGVLAHTNGIALLAQRGLGSAAEANAARVFDWLSGYLAHPAGGAGVLAEPALALGQNAAPQMRQAIHQ